MKAEVKISCTIREYEYLIEGLRKLGKIELSNGKILGTNFDSEDRTKINVLVNTIKRKK